MKRLLIFICVLNYLISCSKDNNSNPDPYLNLQDTLMDWQKIDPGTTDDIISVRFFDAKNGLFSAYHEGIYRSTDSGKSWALIRPVPASKLMSKLSIVDQKNGFASGEDSLYITANGGITWTSKKLPGLYGVVYFLSPAVGYYNSSNNVYKTSDTGTTWVKVFSNLSGQIFFSSIDIGFANDYSQGLYKTLNGGQTWTKISNGITQPFSNPFAFSSDLIGWACNGEALYKTIDGGVNWAPVRYGKITDLHFLTDKTGFLRMTDQSFKIENQLYFITDGGATINRICKTGKSEIRGWFFIDAGTGWACGTKGLLIRYKK